MNSIKPNQTSWQSGREKTYWGLSGKISSKFSKNKMSSKCTLAKACAYKAKKKFSLVIPFTLVCSLYFILLIYINITYILLYINHI